MLNVSVLARSPLQESLASMILGKPNLYLALNTGNIRNVLSASFRKEDVLIMDDEVLGANQGVQATIAQLSCHKYLVGQTNDFNCARRAILVNALDVLDETTAARDLPAILEQHQPSESVQPESTVISIYSAKGGVGKTTIALNLAWAMAELSSQSVALMDLDMFGDVGSMLTERPPISMVEMVEGVNNGMSEEKLLQSLYVAPLSNLTIVPSSINPQRSEMVRPEQITRVIGMMKTKHAYIILDLATGLTENNLAALDASDCIMVLTAPEQVTLKTVARSMTVLEKLYHGRLAVVLNRTDAGAGLGPDDVARMLRHPVTYTLSSGGSGPVKASNQGIPLVALEPKNVLAVEILRIANQLVTEQEGSRRSRKKSLVAMKS